MDCRTQDGITVVSIDRRLDAYAAQQMGPALEDLLRRGAGKVLFNFSRTEFISSAGLRLLLSTAKTLQKTGGRYILCSLQPNVRKVFEMTGITHLFSICDSEEEALSSFG
jgi:anti-anti-sigma factor